MVISIRYTSAWIPVGTKIRPDLIVIDRLRHRRNEISVRGIADGVQESVKPSRNHQMIAYAAVVDVSPGNGQTRIVDISRSSGSIGIVIVKATRDPVFDCF